MPDSSEFVDFYEVLGVPTEATQQQIRDAYKRAALESHPDRVHVGSAERSLRTQRFQVVNEAYYILSDLSRRSVYDAERRNLVKPNSGKMRSSWFSENRSSDADSKPTERQDQKAHDQFGTIFEDMMREEGMAEGGLAQPTGKFWSLIGGASGGALGFIVANVPGALAGAVAGNRLGAIRDSKGKSVYMVFQDLPQSDKAKLLSELATKAFAHAVSV